MAKKPTWPCGGAIPGTGALLADVAVTRGFPLRLSAAARLAFQALLAYQSTLRRAFAPFELAAEILADATDDR